MNFNELAEKLEHHPLRGFGRGVEETEIDDAATRLGVVLTGGYRCFLRRFGWGGVGALELFGLGSDVPSYLSLIELTRSEREEMRPALPMHLVPLMNDGGGNLYCLDTRRGGEPPVVFWEHSGGEGQVPAQVAVDFITWLAERVRVDG